MTPITKELFEAAEHDVKHHWEQYSLEVMHICRKLTDKFEGRIIRYKPLGRPEQRGVIRQFMDRMGLIVVYVQSLPKSGKEGSGKEIYIDDIKFFEPKSKRSKVASPEDK